MKPPKPKKFFGPLYLLCRFAIRITQYGNVVRVTMTCLYLLV